MNNFEFYNPTRIVFGKDTIKKLNKYVPKDIKVLIAYGGGSIKRNGVYQQVIEALGTREVFEFGEIERNPHYETCMKCVEYAKKGVLFQPFYLIQQYPKHNLHNNKQLK